MNIKKVEKQHRKIGQLLENIKEDGKASAIEKDLLLSYIRDMYERVMLDNTNSSESSKVERVSTSSFEYSQKERTPNETPPSSFSLEEVVRKEVIQEAPTPSAVFETVQVAVESTPVVEETPKIEVPQELADLFTQVDVSELSDRLSRTPITDLNKCMGINEKIFTVNELFGGDSGLFNSTMSTLDKMTSLNEAKEHLVEHVAIKQDWASADKIKKADKFIKLISRRYA